MAGPARSDDPIDVDYDSLSALRSQRLFDLWEDGSWSAHRIDLSEDVLQWQVRVSDGQRRALSWLLSLFLGGEYHVSTTLAPFMAAVPYLEDKVYLATQLADEARHFTFLDRYVREVLALPNRAGDAWKSAQSQANPHYEQLFAELTVVAARLRRNPGDLPLLAQGVLLYHLILEGMLARTGTYFLRRFFTRVDILPVLARTLDFIDRDESRHIAFGVQLLKKLISSSAECRAAAITMCNRVFVDAAGAWMPPGLDWSLYGSLGLTAGDLGQYSLRSITTKLRRIGIPPSDVAMLVATGALRSAEVQAERTRALHEGGVVSFDAPATVADETLAAVFDGMQDLADWFVSRVPTLRVVIQWSFDDGRQRYLVMREGRSCLGQGLAHHPDLALKCSARDWVAIYGQQLPLREAVLRRRLKVSGRWSAIPASLTMLGKNARFFSELSELVRW